MDFRTSNEWHDLAFCFHTSAHRGNNCNNDVTAFLAHDRPRPITFLSGRLHAEFMSTKPPTPWLINSPSTASGCKGMRFISGVAVSRVVNSRIDIPGPCTLCIPVSRYGVKLLDQGVLAHGQFDVSDFGRLSWIGSNGFQSLIFVIWNLFDVTKGTEE